MSGEGEFLMGAGKGVEPQDKSTMGTRQEDLGVARQRKS